MSPIKIITALFLFFATPVYAADLGFENISQTDLENIISELGANFNHSPVSGASSLGNMFGIELGVVGGITQSPLIDALAKEVTATNNASSVPHAAILGRLGLPMGFTFDAGFIPSVGSTSFKFNTLGLGISYLLSGSILPLPFNLAARLGYSSFKLTFPQTLPGPPPIDSTIEAKTSNFDITFIASKGFAIIEPYLGVGYVSSSGDLGVTNSTNTGTIFDFTSSQSASGSKSGLKFMLGAELDLFIIKIGAEWMSLLGTSQFNGKVAFGF